ncbi:MAG: RusA family crossover junction endodeoxyribonuclease [Gemmatales bacterium]|nr:RusA family crossover junction endodeoxyribonuclease [Gemmatales bacterium]
MDMRRVYITPMATPRPHFRCLHGRPQTYMPHAYRVYLAKLALAFRDLKPVYEPVVVSIELSFGREEIRNGGDLDNYAKAVLDALVQARILADDGIRFVRALTVAVLPDSESYVAVTLSPLS